MKASELRIGNYIFLTKDVNKSYVITKTSGAIIDYIECKSVLSGLIPLTEEWLLKFGFEKPNSERPYHFKKSSTEFLWSEYQGELKCYFNEVPMFSFPCKYVHTFQNIYYSITGQELTIKEL